MCDGFRGFFGRCASVSSVRNCSLCDSTCVRAVKLLFVRGLVLTVNRWKQNGHPSNLSANPNSLAAGKQVHSTSSCNEVSGGQNVLPPCLNNDKSPYLQGSANSPFAEVCDVQVTTRKCMDWTRHNIYCAGRQKQFPQRIQGQYKLDHADTR